MSVKPEEVQELGDTVPKLPWAIGIVMVVLAYSVLSDAFVLSRLWLWYAVPQGLMALTWKPFAGLVLGLTVIGRKKHGAEPADARTLTTRALHFVGYVLVPWMALAVGWVLR
jgi:hypothetical protein